MIALELVLASADVAWRYAVPTLARGALSVAVGAAHFALGVVGAACDSLGRGRR